MNELPPGWVLTTLGSITQPSQTRAHPSELPEARYIGLEHVESQKMRIIKTDTAKNYKSSAVLFHAGSVLYGRLRPYLNKVVKPTFDGLCSGEFIVFSETNNLSSDFLLYMLNSLKFVSFASHLKEGSRRSQSSAESSPKLKSSSRDWMPRIRLFQKHLSDLTNISAACCPGFAACPGIWS